MTKLAVADRHGLGRAQPQAVDARSAFGDALERYDVLVNGEDRMVRVRAVTRPVERWELGGGIVATGAPAAAAVRLLARGAIAARGVVPPERCVEPDDLFPELEAHGTTFEVSEREVVAS